MTVDSASVRKSFGQFCPMATALDFVGDRWTILILRELLGGPARFGDLKDGLPGIATNLLTERLRRLEGDGIVRRLDAARSGLYALTDAGESIRAAVEELGIWGARMARTVGPVARPIHERSIRAISMAMQAILVRSDALPAQGRVLELEIDGECAEIWLGPRPTVTARPSMQPDARVRSTSEAIAAFLLGSPADDTVTFQHASGDPDATRLLIIALGIAG